MVKLDKDVLVLGEVSNEDHERFMKDEKFRYALITEYIYVVNTSFERSIYDDYGYFVPTHTRAHDNLHSVLANILMLMYCYPKISNVSDLSDRNTDGSDDYVVIRFNEILKKVKEDLDESKRFN